MGRGDHALGAHGDGPEWRRVVMRPQHGGQVRGKRGRCQGQSAYVGPWCTPHTRVWRVLGLPSRRMVRMGTPIWVADGLRGRRGQASRGGLAGRRAGGSWANNRFKMLHFVPFPIWGLGRLGMDLGGFDTRMGRNGTHLERNGTLRRALAATVRRGYLPGRGAAHRGNNSTGVRALSRIAAVSCSGLTETEVGEIAIGGLLRNIPFQAPRRAWAARRGGCGRPP